MSEADLNDRTVGGLGEGRLARTREGSRQGSGHSEDEDADAREIRRLDR